MKLLFAISLLFLASCASSPKTVILNPSYSSGAISNIQAPVQVTVADNRISNFTIRVVDQEPALYLPDANIPTIVEETFKQALQVNGATVSAIANNKLVLHITEFSSLITESLSKHHSVANARFSVEVVQGNRRFEKSYSAKSELNGPLRHDQAKIESQLNDLTEMLITRIVSDQELIHFLQGS
ncbi:YajG family lipoprotein [Pseudoalteromonas sp. T1lg23B]|uniref:YajG family lipoprotein n=1 Tax=Pseudoalteromonas sp. T1lg23B TaxID=2077097 RepID=UPI000CF6B0DB|nr:YajG family lipoprotein [Pseudoalteromonas sp. T1lg23B]